MPSVFGSDRMFPLAANKPWGKKPSVTSSRVVFTDDKMLILIVSYVKRLTFKLPSVLQFFRRDMLSVFLYIFVVLYPPHSKKIFFEENTDVFGGFPQQKEEHSFEGISRLASWYTFINVIGLFTPLSYTKIYIFIEALFGLKNSL